MSAKKIGLTAAAVLATFGIVVGGASLANAESGTTSSTSSSSGAVAGAPAGAAGQGSQDTAVTGDELAKVTAAMTAEDSSVTVTEVRKDPDGSYDVLGTKDGSPVFYDVSSDLTTFTANTMQAPTGTSGQAPTGQPPSGTATPSATTTTATTA